MEFDLSEDQQALAAAARDLLDGYASAEKVRAHLESGAPYDEALWGAMVEQGWLAITLSEDLGGIGFGWVEAALLLEEAGRHVAPAPFLPSLLAVATIADGDPAGHRWLEPLVAGESIGAVAWSSRPDAFTAVQTGDEWALTGRSDPVDAASLADVVVVSTGTDVFLVDLTVVGRPEAQPAMDETRQLSWLELDGAPALRIGGQDLATSLLDRGALGASAEMLGGAEWAMDTAVEYAKERVQFGQPIGSFQAVKHRCADMLVDVEGMRSVVWFGAWCLSPESEEDPSDGASTAKIWCTDASERVMGSSLQVHGGIGFTWEHDLHRYVKRAQFDRQSYGDSHVHRARLATAIRAEMAAGGSFI